jgi:hypothetical protein
MKPKPGILMFWSAPDARTLVEIAAATEDSCFALCLDQKHDERPRAVNIRVSSAGKDGFKFPRVAHAHPGHAQNLADRCNARFRLVPKVTDPWFAAFKMIPAEEFVGAVDRKGGATSTSVRRIYRPKA